jgi:exosortase A-associated hydrolase 1
VLIVVGGPQYRVGSHRQFVLLARSLAQAGIAAMRFDYRGMGDSDGEPRTFEHVHDDIAAALDHFHSVVPGLQRLVLWGLCDGASASLAHAALDRRVTGLVLLNPWVRTEAGIAGAYLRRYYLQRFFDPDFWSKVRRGEFDVGASVASAVRLMRAALGVRSTGAAPSADRVPADRVDLRQPLPVRMLAELRRYAGRVLVILSGDDLTAEEFRRTTGKSRAWRRELAKPRVTRHQLPAANHTFSREVWRDQVASWTAEWVRSL